MDLTNIKSLSIDGVSLKQLFINGVQAWAEVIEEKINLFNGVFPSKKVSGVTFSWNDEEKILTIDGTATANIASVGAYSCSSINIPAGTYKVSCKTVGGSYTYGTATWFRFGNTGTSVNAYTLNIDESKTMTFTVDINAFAPRIQSGTVFNNLQLQLVFND